MLEKRTSPIYKEKWVAAAIGHDDFKYFLLRDLALLLRNILKEGTVSRVVFEKKEKAVLLIFKASQANNDLLLKPELQTYFDKYFNKDLALKEEVGIFETGWYSLFSNKSIKYKDYYTFDLVSAGGLPGSQIYAELISKSSELIFDFILDEGSNWDLESAIEKTIPLHLGILKSFGLSKLEIVDFYSFYLNNNFNSIEKPQFMELDLYKQGLMSEFDKNFQLQKQALTEYIEFFFNRFSEESFDEDWLKSWVELCSSMGEKVLKLEYTNQSLYRWIELDKNSNKGFSPKYIFLEKYLRNLHLQLEIDFLFESNLIYSLGEAIKIIRRNSIV